MNPIPPARSIPSPANLLPARSRAGFLGLWLRSLLLGTISGAIWLTPALAAGPLKKVRFLTDWYPQPEHGGFYYALLKGYYREAGLDVEIQPGGPTAFAIPRVASGQSDIGMSTSDEMLLSLERKIPVVAIGATMQHDPQAIMVHEGSRIRRFEDLEGQTIAVSPGTVWFRYLAQRYKFQGVKERPLTFSLAAFLADTNYVTQCFVTSEPFIADQSGTKVRTLLLQETGYDPYRVFFTTRKYLAQNPEVVRGFVTASIRGWQDYLKDAEAVHEELKRRNPELNPEKMTFSWQALKTHRVILGDPAKGDLPGAFRDERWAFQFRILKDLGLLKSSPDYRQAYTTEYCNPRP
jgi:NitT/TauT family transport system substrate-binding protein